MSTDSLETSEAEGRALGRRIGLLLRDDPEVFADHVAAHRRKTADVILNEAASTFRESNAIYMDNYKMVAPIIRALFPNGVPPELVASDRWHLFELMIVKMTRFAVSQLTHQDSIRDLTVYAAMVESLLQGDAL